MTHELVEILRENLEIAAGVHHHLGRSHMNLHVVAPKSPLIRYLRLDDLLSFHVHEATTGSVSARGNYWVPRFPGVVRPLLNWQTSRGDEQELVFGESKYGES
ncbi:MAG TPA: hypothetical protein ENI80_12865 [Acidiferrobacteraceae bacterium]|nr:hypothetical protein [Acidiferrobacteraceae bacterium]